MREVEQVVPCQEEMKKDVHYVDFEQSKLTEFSSGKNKVIMQLLQYSKESKQWVAVRLRAMYQDSDMKIKKFRKHIFGLMAFGLVDTKKVDGLIYFEPTEKLIEKLKTKQLISK